MNEELVDVDDSEGSESTSDQPGRSRFAIIAVIATVAIPLLVLALNGTRGGTQEDLLVDTSVPTDVETSIVDGDVSEPDAVDGPDVSVEDPEEPPMPVLPVNLGLEIWVGGDSRISRIDLDTGRRVQIDRRGYPVLATGSSLIFYDSLSREFRSLDRTSPEDSDRPIDAGDDFEVGAVAESALEGALWVADVSGAEISWRLLSLTTGAPLRSTTTTHLETMRIADPADLAIGPETDVRDGVVWRLEGAQHVPWFTGSVIARDTTRALVENCDEVCEIEWRDLESGERLDQPIPPLLPDTSELLGDGTWIYGRSDDITTSIFLNTTTFQEVDTKTRRLTRPFDIEPSGEWAAMTGSQRVWLLELATGEETPVPGGRSLVGTSSSVVFAPAV